MTVIMVVTYLYIYTLDFNWSLYPVFFFMSSSERIFTPQAERQKTQNNETNVQELQVGWASSPRVQQLTDTAKN